MAVLLGAFCLHDVLFKRLHAEQVCLGECCGTEQQSFACSYNAFASSISVMNQPNQLRYAGLKTTEGHMANL